MFDVEQRGRSRLPAVAAAYMEDGMPDYSILKPEETSSAVKPRPDHLAAPSSAYGRLLRHLLRHLLQSLGDPPLRINLWNGEVLSPAAAAPPAGMRI